MIYDPVDKFYTDADQKKLDAYNEAVSSLTQKMAELNNKMQRLKDMGELTKAKYKELSKPFESLTEELMGVVDAESKARASVEDRYIASLKNAEAVYKDVKKIISSVTVEDFLTDLAYRKARLSDTVRESIDKRYSEGQLPYPSSILYGETFIACRSYIQRQLRVQLNALHEFGKDDEVFTVLRAVNDKTEELGFPITEPEKKAVEQIEKEMGTTSPELALYFSDNKYIPVYYSHMATDVARLSSKGVIANPISGSLTLKIDGTEITVEDFSELSASMGVSTHKLLITAMADVTQRNYYGAKDSMSYRAIFPLKGYLEKLGYDITERPTSTPEEAEKEKKRVKNNIDNGRKAVKKDMELLFRARASWKEKVKGKEEAFLDVRILGAKGINREGNVYMEFTPAMMDYLSKQPLTQYSTALLSVDARNSNAYNMGLKMVDHYNNDNNLVKGTASRLKVKTLLKVTSLPTYEDLKSMNDARHWERKIKEPFENNLDVLYQNHVIDDWYYAHPKGVRLTDAEAMSINSYDIFENLNIEFSLPEAPDHTERLARKEELKKERIARAQQKRSSSKKKNKK